MWVTKLLISQVKKRIFCPKTTKFGPKLAFLVNLGQAMQAHLVGGCGARAVSRKTPIHFIVESNKKKQERKILVVGPLEKTWTLPQLAASLCGVWIYADHRHTQYLYSASMLRILCLYSA